MHKKYYATEVVRAVDDIKKIFLMCEHLGKVDAFNKAVETFDVNSLKKGKNIESFAKKVQDFVDRNIMPLIGETVRTDLEYGDYEVYTDEYHHRKFWNEIPLPEIAVKIVDAYKALTGLEYKKGKKYSVSIYDLSDDELYFDTKKELDAFLEDEDVAPYTAFKIVKKAKYDEFVELYSA